VLPERIRTRQRLNSLDLPEHRQIGACLRFWSSWLNAAAEAIVGRPSEADSEVRQSAGVWADRCRRLTRRIGFLAGAPPLAELAEVPARRLLSPLFRNDGVYRRFYRLWQDIDLGIASIFGDFLKARTDV
jgi:hypothetical protein